MKFLCPSCKAKYQIADEKIGGRTLKMDCRRCGHTIVLRADQAQDDGSPESVAPAASAPAVAPPAGRATTSSPGAQPAGSRGGSGLLHPQSGSRRPAAASGRSGSHVGPSPARAAPRASMGGPGHGAGSALGADFRRHAGSAPAAPETGRTTPLDQWHVAINDVPVGPMRRDEITRKISTGAIHQDSLAWREGFDDWRPLREIPELAALLRRTEGGRPSEMPRPPAARIPAPGARTASPTASRPATGRSATVQPSRPAAPAASARSNVVAIGGRLGASAAPALEDDEPLDELESEPTRVASGFDFAAADAAAKRESSPEPAKAPAPRPPTGSHKTSPKATSSTTTSTPRKSSPPPAAAATPRKSVAPPAPERISSLPDPFPASPPASSATSSSPGLAGVGSSASSPSLSAASPAAASPAIAYREKEPREKERRGLPVGAWIGIAGAMSFGVAMAVMIAPRLLGGTDTSPAPAIATTVAAPASEPVEAAVDTTAPPTPAAEEAPAAPPTTDETPAPATGGTRTGGSRTPRTTTGTGATGTGTSGTGATTATKATSARFAAFADDGAGAAPIDTRATEAAAAGTRSATGTGDLSADQIRSVVSRGQRQLQACWELEIRGMHDVQSTRMDIDVTIGASGTVTRATARGVGMGNLSECIERNVRRWHFPPSGGETQTSFPIVFTGV